MKSSNALLVLAELTSAQWGMVTSAQAGMHAITRLDLSRLAEAGHLVRLAHGVYRDAGAPGDEFEDLRAAWLSTDPRRSASDRLRDSTGFVVSGASAANLYRIGDLPADRHEFTGPKRRQSQRAEVHYRQRDLNRHDVTVTHGLPVTTIERTIADLLETRTDFGLVVGVLRDASAVRRLDPMRLEELLAPLAARLGFRKGDGTAVLDRLMQLAGLDASSLVRRLQTSPSLSALTELARQVENVG
jgi:chorismate mutase